VVAVPLSSLEITTCRFAFRFCRKSVGSDVAKTLFYRQLMHIGGQLV
jgi:hypothetical protein